MNKKIGVLLVFGTFFSGISFAQSEAGHGGTGVSCIGAKSKLAEYYEPEFLPGLKNLQLIESNQDIDAQIDSAIDQLAVPELQTKLKKIAHLIEATALNNPLTNQVDWGVIQDANKIPLKAGCELKTIVYYNSPIDVTYSKTLYDELTPSQKAALWVHEAVFRVVREVSKGKIQKSLPARRIVELLFSENRDRTILSGLTQKYLLKSDYAVDASSVIIQMPAIQEFTGEKLFYKFEIEPENKSGYANSEMGTKLHIYGNGDGKDDSSTPSPVDSKFDYKNGLNFIVGIDSFRCAQETLRNADGSIIGGGVIGLQSQPLNPRTIHMTVTDENEDVLLDYHYTVTIPAPYSRADCGYHDNKIFDSYVIPSSVLKFEAGVN